MREKKIEERDAIAKKRVRKVDAIGERERFSVCDREKKKGQRRERERVEVAKRRESVCEGERKSTGTWK